MSQFLRPSWDEYFMSIAKVVAMRSNCMKRKVAAIIVRDRGLFRPDNTALREEQKTAMKEDALVVTAWRKAGRPWMSVCAATGQENAITQAAYHGTSLKGATLIQRLRPARRNEMIINSGNI